RTWQHDPPLVVQGVIKSSAKGESGIFHRNSLWSNRPILRLPQGVDKPLGQRVAQPDQEDQGASFILEDTTCVYHSQSIFCLSIQKIVVSDPVFTT
ncbi:MAG: hypothetical protein LBE31_05190, partial [Deltaproteobacteria bacterium]|nr:hypothetical protein [Deltaproteobacteria bacterium]